MARRPTATPKQKPNTSSAAREGTTQVQFRIPDGLLESLKEYVEELNDGRYPKLTRTDVVLGLIAWAIRTRPDWDSRSAK